MCPELKDAYPFYKANIHERRWAAFFCRLFPLGCVFAVLAAALYGTFHETKVLLIMTALFNVSLWLWVVSTALLSIYTALFKMVNLESGPQQRIKEVLIDTGGIMSDGTGGTACSAWQNCSMDVRHLIIVPNYKEDENMLKESLESLAECEDSDDFWVVLAMEAREDAPLVTVNAKKQSLEGDDWKGEGTQKGERLQSCFSNKFARILRTSHPYDLFQQHLDGSEDAEVPGKASNLKYAVEMAYKECQNAEIDLASVLLTVADADCLFHPAYFSEIGREFGKEKDRKGSCRTMWQAPQIPYRNFYTAPIVSRVWSYVASTYEFGGLSSSLYQFFGKHHMIYSTYTMPLQLAVDAEAWDGDVIAEDHHAFLKCFYYSLYSHESISTVPEGIRIQPVFKPVKSTSVASEGYFQSWIDRWFQAKRHAQGVAEISYALLATYDAFMTQPWRRMLAIRMLCRLWQVIFRIFCMHILPICQTICLGLLTVKWFRHNRNIDGCPDRLWFFGDLHQHGAVISRDRYFLCGMAGAWVLTWPVVIPWILIVVSNFLLLHRCFLRPAEGNAQTIWHSEDGKVPNRSSWRVLFWIIFDCVFGMSWILMPYGFMVELVAYVNVALFGNHFSYVTASKGMCSRRLKSPRSSKSLLKSDISYGTMAEQENANLKDHGDRDTASTCSGSTPSEADYIVKPKALPHFLQKLEALTA